MGESVTIKELFENEELDRKTIETMVNMYEGKTIYLSKEKIKKQYKRMFYNDLKRLNMKRASIVKKMVEYYEISIPHAYRLIKEFENEAQRD